jgi:ubiquinone/menaquinone biosynthesis C-methylase UbiE
MTHKYWERAAKEDPYAAICTGWDAERFDSESDNPIIGSDLLNKEMAVLDVACGIGRMAKYIAPKVRQYVGVDFSSGMIEKAKERYRDYPNVRFLQNDGKGLGVLKENEFDLAICYLAFQHMTRKVTRNYVNEVHRVIKPGGIFITDIPRLDHYKDDKFAFKQDEIIDVFKKFSEVKYRPETGKAYFIIQARK